MPKSLQESIPKINLGTFIGGESVDLKNGISGAFYSSLGMDFRPKASQAGILPGLKNVSNSLSDLITVMEQDLNGIRYGVGDAGHFYKVDASNTITDLGTLNSAGGAGMEYNPLTDNLYMSTQQAVSLYGQCTKTPTLKKDQFGASASIAPSVIYTFNGSTSSYDGGLNGGVATQRNNLNTLTVQGITPTNYAAQVTNTLTNTYAPPTAISESAGAFCGFVPDIEPFYGIAVYLTVKGTGDLTLTMHDSLNNNLGAVTIANAALTTGWNLFVFAAPGVRAFVNAIQSNTLSTGYHFHITSSVSSDATRIATIVANDLTGVNFVLFEIGRAHV